MDVPLPRSSEVIPVRIRGCGWKASEPKRLAAYAVAALETSRAKLERVEGADIEAAREYVELLRAVIEWLESEAPEMAALTNPLTFGWRSRTSSVLATHCLRTELVLATTVWVTDLINKEGDKDAWILAVRLVRYVTLPQLNLRACVAPSKTTQAPLRAASFDGQRELLATALMKLQIHALVAWEKGGTQTVTGAKLAKWAVVHLRALASRQRRGNQPLATELDAIADEVEGIMWQYALVDRMEARQELVRCAIARFRRLGRHDRVTALLQHQHTSGGKADESKANALIAHITPLSACVGFAPVSKPPAIPEKHKKMLRTQKRPGPSRA